MSKELDVERMLRDVMGDLNALQAANGALRRQITEAKNQQQQLLIVLAALVKHHHAGRVDVPLSVITSMPEDGKVSHWTSEVDESLCIGYTEPGGAPAATELGTMPEINDQGPPKLVVLP